MLPVTSISPSIFISEFFFSSASTNLLTELPCYYIRAVLEQRRGYFGHPFSLERKKGAVSFANMCNQQIALMYEYATKPKGYMFFLMSVETISVVFTLQFCYLSFQKLTKFLSAFFKGIHASNDFVLLGT